MRKGLMEVFALSDGNPIPRHRMYVLWALTLSCMLLLTISSSHTVNARERVAGDVQRVAMIGFTITDVDREANFFMTVLRFEKIADFRRKRR